MDIIVTIRIPEGEYKQWDDYEKGGLDQVKKELRKDLSYHLDSLGIECDMDIKSEK